MQFIFTYFPRKAIAIAIAAVLYIPSASAQECNVNHLVINSGYNPIDSTMLAPGAQDIKWKLTAGTTAFLSASGATIGANAEVISPNNPGWTASNPNSRWISYKANGSVGYNTPNGLYEMSHTYEFKLCRKDTVTFNISISRDDYIKDILVDGNAAGIFSENAQGNVANYSGYATGSNTLILNQGTHTLTIVCGNYTPNPQPTNPQGMNFFGSIHALHGSLIGPGCPPGYVCAELAVANSISNNADASFLAQNSPNPANGETTIGYEVKDMKSFAAIVVFDINGKEVLNEPITKKGVGSVKIAAGNIAPGVYIYSLVIDGREISKKKMVLTR